MAIPDGISNFFSVFSNKPYNFDNNKNVKNIRLVSGAGIQTRDLSNMSLLQ